MLENKTVAAVIVAAGASVRMGFDKLLYPVDGVPVFAKSLLAFDACDAVDSLVLVAGKNRAQLLQALPPLHKPLTVVDGGATRAQSVRCGVQAAQAQLLAVHDAARPFVSQPIILRTLQAAAQCGAAAPAVPVKDTVKQTDADGRVIGTPPRSSLFAVQTPQAFTAEVYRAALETAWDETLTDDCALAERAGFTVQLVQGEYENYKITTRDDLRKAAGNMRIGHGYDVHKLVENRSLILGGVTVPYTRGLLGHSDADVLTHAVMDALLGAAALGDIGHLFPDTDDAYKGADSIDLLRRVTAVLAQHGYTVGNVDATVLAQAPRLSPYTAQMRQTLADAMGVPETAVSVKATTEEGLGFTGDGSGIAAHAVALIL